MKTSSCRRCFFLRHHTQKITTFAQNFTTNAAMVASRSNARLKRGGGWFLLFNLRIVLQHGNLGYIIGPMTMEFEWICRLSCYKVYLISSSTAPVSTWRTTVDGRTVLVLERRRRRRKRVLAMWLQVDCVLAQLFHSIVVGRTRCFCDQRSWGIPARIGGEFGRFSFLRPTICDNVARRLSKSRGTVPP